MIKSNCRRSISDLLNSTCELKKKVVNRSEGKEEANKLYGVEIQTVPELKHLK